MIETEKIEKFQEFIKYEFKEISLLKKTLTTKGYGNQNNTPHFEGMDTVGDKLLDFILIAEKFNQGERNRERLNKARIAGMNLFLTRIGIKDFRLGEFIIGLPNELKNLEGTDIPADILEALIYSVYIDSNGDINTVKSVIANKIMSAFNRILSEYRQSRT